MRYHKLVLVPILFLVFAMAGCDNDSNSNAQEPVPPTVDCPCFTLQDVSTISVNAEGFSCDFSPWELTLVPNTGGLDNALAAGCLSASTDCTCFGPGSGSMLMNVSLDEASMCMNTLINGLINLGPDGLDEGGCRFTLPVN